MRPTDFQADDDDNQTDAEIRQLLKSVPIPGDLVEDLLEIGTVDVVRAEPMAGGRTDFRWMLMASAACYVIFLGLVLLSFQDAAPKTIASSVVSEENAGNKTQATPPEADSIVYRLNNPFPDLGGMSERLDSLESKIEQLKLSNLRQRLRKLEQTVPAPGGEDQLSIVLAISDQTATHHGLPSSEVIDDMQSVIAHYPKSKGAELASAFINENNQR